MTDEPTYEEIVGTPAEVARDARDLLPYRVHSLLVTCLLGEHLDEAGLFSEWGEIVTLPDGSQMTARDWLDESRRARHRRGRRFRWACARCGRDTMHIAEGIR